MTAGFRSLVGRGVGGLSAPPPPPSFPGYRSFIGRHLGGLSALAFVPPPTPPAPPPPSAVMNPADSGGHVPKRFAPGRELVGEDRRAAKRRRREELALMLGKGHL